MAELLKSIAKKYDSQHAEKLLAEVEKRLFELSK
jgi:hypothetical protein